MTVKLDDLQVSFKDEGYRYGKTYLCVCLPTFQLLDMKKIKRNIAETITGPTKQEKETNVVMSALVWNPMFADKFLFVQKEILYRYWNYLGRNGTLPDQGSTGWVEWAHCTFLTDTRHTHGSSTPVPALALILQGNENLFLHRTQLACTGSLEEQTNNPASDHIFTAKHREVLNKRHSSGYSLMVFESLINQEHLISPDSASHHCSSALEITSNIFLLILTALVDQAPNVR